MIEPYKISRVLPPHELNARRNRKRSLTTLPGVAHLQPQHPRDHQEHASPNDTAIHPGAVTITHAD